MDISQAPEHLSMTLVLSSGSDPGSSEPVTEVRSGGATVINRPGVVGAFQHTML